jgi:phosphoribosylglycinamide formyltransferase-1
VKSPAPPTRRSRFRRGSNLQSIIDASARAELDATVAIVISIGPKPTAAREVRDRSRISGRVITPDATITIADRQAPEGSRCRPHLSAGFMRRIGEPLLEAFPNRILNIHPSLLPAFPGLDAQRQALEHGVRVSGATVHLVTSELDTGPIVLQAAVPVLDADTVETLSARILIEEHRLYPEAIRLVLEGGWELHGRRFIRPPRDGASTGPLQAGS